MEDTSDAWMNDDVGTIESDSDDEVKEGPISHVKKVEEPNPNKEETKKEVKPAIAGLPMEDASDAWMNDDIGTIESDSDDEVKEGPISHVTKVEEPNPNKEEIQKEVKPAIAGLPMEDASDAWMNDDVGTIESD